MAFVRSLAFEPVLACSGGAHLITSPHRTVRPNRGSHIGFGQKLGLTGPERPGLRVFWLQRLQAPQAPQVRNSLVHPWHPSTRPKPDPNRANGDRYISVVVPK